MACLHAALGYSSPHTTLLTEGELRPLRMAKLRKARVPTFVAKEACKLKCCCCSCRKIIRKRVRISTEMPGQAYKLIYITHTYTH